MKSLRLSAIVTVIALAVVTLAGCSQERSLNAQSGTPSQPAVLHGPGGDYELNCRIADANVDLDEITVTAVLVGEDGGLLARGGVGSDGSFVIQNIPDLNDAVIRLTFTAPGKSVESHWFCHETTPYQWSVVPRGTAYPWVTFLTQVFSDRSSSNSLGFVIRSETLTSSDIASISPAITTVQAGEIPGRYYISCAQNSLDAVEEQLVLHSGVMFVQTTGTSMTLEERQSIYSSLAPGLARSQDVRFAVKADAAVSVMDGLVERYPELLPACKSARNDTVLAEVLFFSGQRTADDAGSILADAKTWLLEQPGVIGSVHSIGNYEVSEAIERWIIKLNPGYRLADFKALDGMEGLPIASAEFGLVEGTSTKFATFKFRLPLYYTRYVRSTQESLELLRSTDVVNSAEPSVIRCW